MSKAERLRDLEAADFAVPPFAVVPAAAFDAFRAALQAPVTEAAILGAPMPTEAEDMVRTALHALGTDLRGPLAVRSSMAGEDGARFAFAGQLESFLNVDGEPAVFAAVRACWASAVGTRVAAYRAAHGISDASPVEVILQRMVQPDAAGVMFTADPVTGDAATVVISAVAGLADALVRGEEPGQTWRIDRATGATERIDGDGPPLLDERRLRELADVGVRVEALFGNAQDIEFAIGGDRVWLLQARPITSPIGRPSAATPAFEEDLPAQDGHLDHSRTSHETSVGASARTGDVAATAADRGPRILWDDSNIAESYSGATSPLTRSVIRDAYGGVYAQFFAIMGVPDADPALMRALLGYYDGRVYYQLQNWYRALALLPGFEHNRRFMDQMMGVRPDVSTTGDIGDIGDTGGDVGAGEEAMPRASANGRSDIGEPQRPDRLRLSKLVWQLGWLVRVVRLHAGIERQVAEFLATVDGVLAEHRAVDARTLPPHALLARYRDLERRVLSSWRAPIVTDFFAMVSFGLLRRLTERWIDPDEAIHNDLLAGQGAIESMVPVRLVGELARMVAGDAALSSAFGPTPVDPRAVLARLDGDPALAPFRERLDEYLERYGDRCPDELKLESPNLRDDPARLVALIAAAVPADVDARPSGDAPGQKVREAAEGRVAALSAPRRSVLRWVLAQAKRHIRNRENMRLARTRVFGDLRDIFGSLGRQWAAAGILDAPDDIFFLTVGEAWDFVEGTAITRDLKGLVAVRRAEHARDLSANPARRFETDGVPYLDGARQAGGAGTDSGRHRMGSTTDGSSASSAFDGLSASSVPDTSSASYVSPSSYSSPASSSPDASMGGSGRAVVLRGIGCGSGRVAGRARVVRDPANEPDLAGDVLVAERTDPGWVFLFPGAAGILVERGSPLSHVAIVAREMGKPTIVGIPGLMAAVRTGDRVTMDGARGEVMVHRSEREGSA